MAARPTWPAAPSRALSGGERQRLFVALALVGRPELVFLDELTQNLDPVGRRHTWDVVRRVRDAGTTVVLVTHDVEEAERLCDRIVVLDRGRVVADGTPAAITADARRRHDGSLHRRRPRRPPAPAAARRPPRDRHGVEVAVEGDGPLLAHVGAHLVAVGPSRRSTCAPTAPPSRSASSPSPPRRTPDDRDHPRPPPGPRTGCRGHRPPAHRPRTSG